MRKSRTIHLFIFVVIATLAICGLSACSRRQTDDTPEEPSGRTLTSISIATPATQTKFEVGDYFNFNGLTVNANYSDNTSELLTSSEIEIDNSAYRRDTLGTYTIVIKLVSDTTKTVSYNVSVVAPRVLTGIRIKTFPSTVVFALYDRFDYSGLEIELVYDDNSTELGLVYSDYSVSHPSMNTVGVETVTVTSDDDPTLTTSFDITLYDVYELDATAVYITTPAYKQTFALGDDFSSDGIVVHTQFEPFGDRLFNGYYNINSDSYNKDVAGEYDITITAYRPNTVSTSYTVKVVDVSTLEVTGLVVSPSSTHVTDFYAGEVFDYSGLRVQKTMTGNVKIDLTAGEFLVDSSAFVSTTPGTYAIEVTLFSDSEVSTTYDVTVNGCPIPDGDYYSNYFFESLNLTYSNWAFRIDNGLYYDYSNTTYAFETTGLNITFERNSDGSLDCYYPTGESSKSRFARYELDTHTTTTYYTSSDDTYTIFFPYDSDDSVVVTVYYNDEPIYSILDKGTSLSANFIGYFISMINGKLYTQNSISSGTVVTTSTVFNSDAELYLIPDPVDYSGKAFLGKYFDEDNEIQYEFFADGTVSYSDASAIYTAQADASEQGNFMIVLVGVTMIFDASDEQLKYSGRTLTKYDSSKHVIVTLTITAEQEDDIYIDGSYVLNKGSSFNTVIDGTAYILTGYTPFTPINEDVTYAVAEKRYIYEINNKLFGTYDIVNYRFYTEDGSVTRGVNAVLSEGVFALTDVDGDDEYTILVKFGTEATFSIIVDCSSNSTVLTIGEDTFTVNEYFKNADFVGFYETEDTEDNRYVSIRSYEVRFKLTAEASGEITASSFYVSSVDAAQDKVVITARYYDTETNSESTIDITVIGSTVTMDDYEFVLTMS